MAEGWRLDAVMPRLTEKTVEWIGQQTPDRPFFLYWAWTSPHAPIVPTAEFRGKSGAGPYGDYVHQSDAHLGRVLQALKDRGLEENTLVIFTADNGPERYAYARITKTGHDSRGPLRGIKRDVWEGGHRVPFVLRWPGVVKPGTVSDQLISQVDLMATVAHLVDFQLPDTAAEDSHDLLPLLRGEAEVSPRTTIVHRTSGKPWAIRHGEWVFIDSPTGALQNEPDFLGYAPNPNNAVLTNLKQDFGQRKNLLKEHPEKAEELRALMADIRQRGYSAPRLLRGGK
jgi:arylsulfatase A